MWVSYLEWWIAWQVNTQTLELYVLASSPDFMPKNVYVTLEEFPRPLTTFTSFTISGQHSLAPVGMVEIEL